MAEYKKGDIAHIGNAIIMNGDSNLDSKSDKDAHYRRLKLRVNDPFVITAVHHHKGSKGRGGAATYDGVYERDGVQYYICDLPEYNLWSKYGWELREKMEGACTE